MTKHFGDVPANSVLPIMFGTIAEGVGSITISGLAVTDIEVYKGTSMTQRASDNGYALIDTDGIDIDGITGIHGISIDLSDNSDASFYSVGSFFTVIVSSITINGQTVSFIAADFRIVAAEAVAGKPKVDVDAIEGSDATNQIRDSIVDDATRIDASALNTLSSHDPGEIIMGATDLGTGAGLTSLASAANLATVAGYLDTEIAAILADTNELQTDWVNGGRLDLLIDAIKASTDNLPSDPADASVIAGRFDAVDASIAGLNDAPDVSSDVTAIKAKTDSLAFTTAGHVDSNVLYVKNQQVTGDGSAEDPWGP